MWVVCNLGSFYLFVKGFSLTVSKFSATLFAQNKKTENKMPKSPEGGMPEGPIGYPELREYHSVPEFEGSVQDSSQPEKPVFEAAAEKRIQEAFSFALQQEMHGSPEGMEHEDFNTGHQLPMINFLLK